MKHGVFLALIIVISNAAGDSGEEPSCKVDEKDCDSVSQGWEDEHPGPQLKSWVTQQRSKNKLVICRFVNYYMSRMWLLSFIPRLIVLMHSTCVYFAGKRRRKQNWQRMPCHFMWYKGATYFEKHLRVKGPYLIFSRGFCLVSFIMKVPGDRLLEYRTINFLTKVWEDGLLDFPPLQWQKRQRGKVQGEGWAAVADAGAAEWW